MTSENFEATVSRHRIQHWLRMDHTPGAGNWITVITERSLWTHFDRLVTKLLIKSFYECLYVISEKRKSHVFKSEKNVKYVFSNTGTGAPVQCRGLRCLVVIGEKISFIVYQAPHPCRLLYFSNKRYHIFLTRSESARTFLHNTGWRKK